MRSKRRCGTKRGRRTCRKIRSRRSDRRVNQGGGGAVCLTGACGAGALKIGSIVMGSLGTFGSYKILSKKKKKGRSIKNIRRSQQFKYEDNRRNVVNFTIKQKNKKVDVITHKKGKKSEKKKNYKTIKQATNAYNKKIKDCIQKGFNKC
jgi:hypothetical protein